MHKNNIAMRSGKFAKTLLENIDWRNLHNISDHEIQHLLKTCNGALRSSRDRTMRKDLEVNFCYLLQEIEFRKANRPFRGVNGGLKESCKKNVK